MEFYNDGKNWAPKSKINLITVSGLLLGLLVATATLIFAFNSQVLATTDQETKHTITGFASYPKNFSECGLALFENYSGSNTSDVSVLSIRIPIEESNNSNNIAGLLKTVLVRKPQTFCLQVEEVNQGSKHVSYIEINNKYADINVKHNMSQLEGQLWANGEQQNTVEENWAWSRLSVEGDDSSCHVDNSLNDSDRNGTGSIVALKTEDQGRFYCFTYKHPSLGFSVKKVKITGEIEVAKLPTIESSNKGGEETPASSQVASNEEQMDMVDESLNQVGDEMAESTEVVSGSGNLDQDSDSNTLFRAAGIIALLVAVSVAGFVLIKRARTDALLSSDEDLDEDSEKSNKGKKLSKVIKKKNKKD